MAFYTFQLAQIEPQTIRSRHTDIDHVTFGVLVNGRDQGHGYAVTPVFPGQALTGKVLTEGASTNGLAHGGSRMSQDWKIGPLAIEDGDEVSIVYTATNLSDGGLPTADQQAFDAYTIKFLNGFYSVLLGQFVSGLGLSAVAELIGANASGAVAAFFADPVGKILGVEPAGPCNGTVFADKKAFTHASLAQLPSTAAQETSFGVTINSAWSELTAHYTDEQTHSHENCGDAAQTNVVIRITRYDRWSLRFSSSSTLSAGMRAHFPHGGNLTELYGLRI